MTAMKLSTLVASALVLATAAGCSKPSPEEQKKQEEKLAATLTSALAAAAAAPTGAPAAKGGAPLTINLPKFGLKGQAAGETEAPIIGDGDPAMVMAATFAANVSEAKKTDPKKLKEGQDAAKIFNPKNMKSETLADGWAITYTNTGSLGTNYFVSVRREIGGKGYLCETTQTTPEQQAAALSFCKSLAK
ncbi:MAG: hypothetical protein U0235_20655 [Polyangiaceae bacterium]